MSARQTGTAEERVSATNPGTISCVAIRGVKHETLFQVERRDLLYAVVSDLRAGDQFSRSNGLLVRVYYRVLREDSSVQLFVSVIREATRVE